ncbi:MAG: phospholipase [Nitrospinae bacterium]|nr:phospholipase [Nitrospinota bacterium]
MNYSNLIWEQKKVIVGQTDLDPTRDITLLMGFHGADSTPENMLVHGARLQLENAVTVYPEGPIDAGKGLWSWWKDGPRQAETVSAFVDYATRMIDAARAHIGLFLPSASVRTCLWGFSQGGAASLVYALLGPHPIHKAASICGFLPELPAAAPAEKMPAEILGIYGVNDGVVPSFLAEFALDEAKGRGHKTAVKETPQGHELTAENLRDIGDFFKT